MNTETAPVKKEQTNGTSDLKQKVVENHKKAAAHHGEAAKHHGEAAKHAEAGNHEKAAISTVKAHGHLNLATEHHNEVVKHHALQA
jgi:hypothetical protein